MRARNVYLTFFLAQAISLLLLQDTSIFGICDSDGAAAQEDLICPISGQIMRDPVESALLGALMISKMLRSGREVAHFSILITHFALDKAAFGI